MRLLAPERHHTLLILVPKSATSAVSLKPFYMILSLFSRYYLLSLARITIPSAACKMIRKLRHEKRLTLGKCLLVCLHRSAAALYCEIIRLVIIDRWTCRIGNVGFQRVENIRAAISYILVRRICAACNIVYREALCFKRHGITGLSLERNLLSRLIIGDMICRQQQCAYLSG